MRVFHFLPSEHAISDLALKRLRISRYSDLNDPFEIMAVEARDERERRAIESTKDFFDKQTGLLCFSRGWMEPALWSHYASKHRGICLGFDIKDELALPIRYTKTRVPVRYINDDPTLGVTPDFGLRLFLTKFKSWSYEDEVRAQMPLTEGIKEGSNYFLLFSADLSLREVILGSLCDLSIESVNALVAALYESVPVRKARLARKTFSIVPDKRFEPKSPKRKA
jgi:hypothetical protein